MDQSPIIARTSRLIVQQLSLSDAPFILRLLNEPSWIEFIGDKQVHDVAAAQAYLSDGPIKMYDEYGMGMYLVANGVSGEPLGLCGLLKRDTLEDVDLGLAFLPEHWGTGYAYEAATAVLQHGREQLGLERIVAITLPTNVACITLLERLGFAFEKEIAFPPDNETLRLYGTDTATLSS